MNLEILDEIDFNKANALFEQYMERCDVIKVKYVEPSPLIISTITVTGCIGSLVNDEIIYNCVELDNDIIYLEKGARIKGDKPAKKRKRVKKKRTFRPQGPTKQQHIRKFGFFSRFLNMRCSIGRAQST